MTNNNPHGYKVGDELRATGIEYPDNVRDRVFTVKRFSHNGYPVFGELSWIADEDADGGLWSTEPASQSTPDMVNHPPHYTGDPSGVECITITRHRNFNIGSAFKYLWRNGLKDDPAQSARAKQIEDLRKAIWYIEDEIKRLESLDD